MDTRALTDMMKAWRHDLHQFPEFGFEETRTSAFVAAKLREFGLEVTECVGRTGVVGTLRRGSGARTIALRADMDALRIHEKGDRPYRSRTDGVMHACGHDGHTTMLLGAARWLSGSDSAFDGTIRFLFQPAEEWGRGALAMLQDGLLDRFPFDEVYGVHNWPGLAVGRFATCQGPTMAAEDLFEITLEGVGGHASRPQGGREVMVAACSLVMDLQTIVSRRINPADIAVVSVTEFQTDGTRNALPSQAVLKGDVRTFLPEVSAAVEAEMRRLAAGTATSFACKSSVAYSREFVPLVNDAASTEASLNAARRVFGENAAEGSFQPVTASEDFARFLEFVPGNFAYLGNGEESWPLHHPCYDFNDEGLTYGVRYFVELVQERLGT